jgi:diguanylate cyclase (GGDEF)-like protein
VAQHRWLGRPASPEFVSSRELAFLFSNLMIARWLIIGQTMDEEEAIWLETRGTLAAAEQLSLVNVTRSYLCWRDVAVECLAEEGRRLDTPPDVIQLAVTAVRTASDAGIMRMARTFDAETQRLREQLASERESFRHQALHDPLTSLPNRLLLHDRLQQAINAARRDGVRVALLLVDLDRFKEVNDSHGHEAGDELLCLVARRLLRQVRSSDTVARLGGDEFAIVLPHCLDVESGLRAARKIVEALGLPQSLGADVVAVEASVGVAFFPDHGEESDPLLSSADIAMYRAKRAMSSERRLSGHVEMASA